MLQHESSLTEQADLSDAELVKTAQAGNMESFTILYDRYLSTVYNRVRYVIPEQDVEDVTQEVFIAVMRSLPNFKQEAQFSTWLRTVTNRRVADYYRKRDNPEKQSDVDMDNSERVPAGLQIDNPITGMDDSIILQDALSNLPAQYRDILLLRFAEGYKFSEIAKIQEQSLEATKSQFRRAIAALRKEMGEPEHE